MPIRLSRWAVSCLLSLQFVQTAVADDCTADNDVRAALDKIRYSHATIAYEGTFLRELSGARQFVRIVYEGDEGDGTLSLRQLNGDVVTGSTQWRAPVASRFSVCDLMSHYTLELLPGGVVAGYPTSELLIKPRDNLRLAYRLNIDPETGLVLKSSVFSSDGKLLERNEFASVSLRKTGDPDLSADSLAENTGFELPGLPSGFLAVRVAGGPPNALHVSDGLASATVIIEPMADTIGPGEGAIIHGATLTYTRGGQVLDGASMLISVIVEVHLATARHC